MTDPTLKQIAVESQADEFADKRDQAERVADFVGATAPEEPQLTPEQLEQKRQTAEAAELLTLARETTPMIGAVMWGLLDEQAVKYGGAKYKLQPEQLDKLARLTGPVLLKYIPKDLSWLATTPEGVLLVAAVMIYAPKVMASDPAPAVASQSNAPPSPAPASLEVRA